MKRNARLVLLFIDVIAGALTGVRLLSASRWYYIPPLLLGIVCFLAVILNYTDVFGNRKTKWIATGLPIKGNKKRAEAFL